MDSVYPEDGFQTETVEIDRKMANQKKKPKSKSKLPKPKQQRTPSLYPGDEFTINVDDDDDDEEEEEAPMLLASEFGSIQKEEDSNEAKVVEAEADIEDLSMAIKSKKTKKKKKSKKK